MLLSSEITLVESSTKSVSYKQCKTHVLLSPVYLVEYDPPYILSDYEGRDIVIKIATVLFVMLPICLLRNISKLEKVSNESLPMHLYLLISFQHLL
jgi:hypothetical protein